MDIEINNQTKRSINNKSITDLYLNINKILNTDIEQLAINIVDTKKIVELNQYYLNHDYATDIITFDLRDEFINEVELFICFDVIEDNAKHMGVSFDSELNRVLIHGVLHIIGYKDKTEKEIEIMRKKEDELLELFHVKH